MDNPLLDDLDETQRSAVTSTAEPLAILAGAGSGKTRVLTRRIAWRADQQDLDPAKTVAVTFTRKAANELRDRLGAYEVDGLTTGTFHSLAYAQLHQRWAERGIRPPELLDRKIGLVASLIARGDKTLPLDTTTELEWISARSLNADTYPAAAKAANRTPPLDMADMVELIDRYAEEKRRRRLVDFDDLLRLCVRDLGDDEFAERVRLRRQHFFVDEFQDINPLQATLLNAWLGGRPDLCVVGDPNQAIYGWNGADASYLRWFADRYPGGTTIRLGHNYRSTPQVVKAGHAVLPSNVRTDKPPTAHRPDGPEPQIRSYPSDRAEAAGVARLAQAAHDRGVTWREQAVLVRTNAQTAIVVEQCRAASIPVNVRGGASLTSQPEVRQLLGEMRRSGHLLSDAFEVIAEQVEAAAPSESAAAAEHDRHSNRQALLRLAGDHLDADPEATTAAFLEWVSSTGAGEGSAAADALDVTTFHAAKGLEWTAVYLLGIERGMVPIGYADTPAELAEERRLLHVGLTRAKETLQLSWAEERTFGSKTVKRTRSPYLDILDPPPEGAASTPVASKTKRRADAAQADLPIDDPEYKKLADWRRDVANEDSMPAYIVFNNRTLAAIVRIRPTTIDELLDVPGIGPAKAERYGKQVLDLLAE